MTTFSGTLFSVVFVITLLCSSNSFKYWIAQTVLPNRQSTSVYLFNFFNSDRSKSTTSVPTPRAKVDTERVNSLKQKLEKVSNSQNRDYNKEAALRDTKPKEIPDKQPFSYNYKKPDEFPNLFRGWIRSDGDQIAKQMIAATKSALKSEKLIEVLFDPVPNLDEVAFGTVWNQKFRIELADNLKVPGFVTNRGGPSTLEWSNIYWANRLAEGLGLKKICAISLSGEGTKGASLPTLKNGMTLLTLADAKRLPETVTGASLLILLSPCQESHYIDGETLGSKLGKPVIALNAPYSFRYDIGGGKPWFLAYVMKRIPKGWIFRAYPRDFEAVIEGPSYEVFRVGTFKTQPSLTEISKVSTSASTAKYGAAGNDRIFEQRL